MRESRHGDKFTLYSLRHFYASRMLGKGMPVFDISRNMGTGVGVIEQYYGKSVTPMSLATRLGD
jgi:integrase